MNSDIVRVIYKSIRTNGCDCVDPRRRQVRWCNEEAEVDAPNFCLVIPYHPSIHASTASYKLTFFSYIVLTSVIHITNHCECTLALVVDVVQHIDLQASSCGAEVR